MRMPTIFLKSAGWCLTSALLVFVLADSALAVENGILQGLVSDVQGRPVEGAVIYIYYDREEMRRRPDFISSAADKEGRCRIVLPQGKYWAVARLKKTDPYGPLMPEDKHSGDPAEFEVAPGSEVTIDFVVANLKEAVRAKAKTRERPVQMAGRIINSEGSPVGGAYAIANRREIISGIPDFLSAWSDSDGRFTLLLPQGKYFIGSSKDFPPIQDTLLKKEIQVESDISGVEILLVPEQAGPKGDGK